MSKVVEKVDIFFGYFILLCVCAWQGEGQTQSSCKAGGLEINVILIIIKFCEFLLRFSRKIINGF